MNRAALSRGCIRFAPWAMFRTVAAAARKELVLQIRETVRERSAEFLDAAEEVERDTVGVEALVREAGSGVGHRQSS